MKTVLVIYLLGVFASLAFMIDYEKNYLKEKLQPHVIAALIVFSLFSWFAFLDFLKEFKDYYNKRWKKRTT